MAGDIGGCVETWLQSTDQPTRNYSATDGAFPSRARPRVLFGGTSNAQLLSPRFPAVAAATRGCVKRNEKQSPQFFIYRYTCLANLVDRKERFAIIRSHDGRDNNIMYRLIK